MKSYLFKLSLSLILLTVSGFSFGQTEKDITFEKRVLKFDKCNEGELIELTYHFTNLGKNTLSIIPPKVDCSCTEVILPETKITPNSTSSIIIKFDTKDKIGFQEREVIIQFISDLMDSRSIDKKLVFKGVVKASEKTKELYKKSKQNK